MARIFAIAAVFDALCSWRPPHKQPMPLAEVTQALNNGAGKHFDPHLIKVFPALASDVYKTLTSSTEAQVKHRLEVMVHKHFAL